MHKTSLESKRKSLAQRTRLDFHMAEWVGFEPTCRYQRQTHFECASL